MAIRVLFCGSRHWDKPIPVDVQVGGFVAVYGADNVKVIHGAAAGADSMAASAAHRHGVACEDYPADWGTHDRDGSASVRCSCPDDASRCRAAGVRRNQLMIDEGKPDLVVAFTNDLKQSRGTRDMVGRAERHGVPAYVIGRPARRPATNPLEVPSG